jgi:hypothetical protein
MEMKKLKKQIKSETKEAFLNFLTEVFGGSETAKLIDEKLKKCGDEISDLLKEYFLSKDSINYFKNEVNDIMNDGLRINNISDIDTIIEEIISNEIRLKLFKNYILNDYINF